MSFWGDSSTDNGNVLALLMNAIPGLAPADVPQITNGRLTNGPNWADYVASAFGRGSEASLLGGADYAFGGALMGQGVALVPELPFEFYVPNVGSVIGEYVAMGGTFASDEVVFLFAGHNDALKIATTGELADPVSVARDLRSNLEVLYGSGARQFVVPTLVAVEATPEVVQMGLDQIVASWVTAYQAEMEKVIAEFKAAHPDAAVMVPDIGALVRKIIADPGKYGFTNVTGTGFDEATGQALPDADNYLWWDVHASNKAQRLFAQEVLGAMGDYYYPRQMLPQAAAAAMQLNRVVAQQTMKRASLRLRQSKTAAEGGDANQLYATPFYGWGSQSGDGLATGFDWKAYGTDIGFQRQLSPVFSVGLNLDLHEADADCDGGGGDSTVKGLGITPYAGYAGKSWRFMGGARYGLDENSANRPLWMTGATAKADFDTDSWAAWGEVDRAFRLTDGVSLTPLLNVNWVRVEGVSTGENGADLLDSNLELDDYNSLQHMLGATLGVSADIGAERDLLVLLTAGWRHEYLDTRTWSSAELAGTTRVLDGPDSDHDALALDLQINCPLPWGASLELAYTGDYSRNANQQSVLLWTKMDF